jgi:hypothetical protein
MESHKELPVGGQLRVYLPVKERKDKKSPVWKFFGHLYHENEIKGRAVDKENFYCRICSEERQLMYPR